jgi:hypothetical protein
MNRFGLVALALAFLLIPALASAAPPRDDRPRRELWQIQGELGDKLDRLGDLQRQTLDLLKLPANARRLSQVKDLTRRSHELQRDLLDLHRDLRQTLRQLGYERRDDRRDDRWDDRRDDHGRPDRAPPPVVIVPPRPLDGGQFAFLLRAIDEATFPNHQLNALRDTIHTGAHFDIGQAQAVLGRFPHETHKVDAALMLCPRIVEPAALPHLLSAFTFESYKQQLRDRTGGQCGWIP